MRVFCPLLAILLVSSCGIIEKKSDKKSNEPLQASENINNLHSDDLAEIKSVFDKADKIEWAVLKNRSNLDDGNDKEAYLSLSEGRYSALMYEGDRLISIFAGNDFGSILPSTSDFSTPLAAIERTSRGGLDYIELKDITVGTRWFLSKKEDYLVYHMLFEIEEVSQEEILIKYKVLEVQQLKQ